jgi:hypothetical protein
MAHAEPSLIFLRKIGSDSSGWVTVYRHRITGGLWKRHFPNGDTHGGGDARFDPITRQDADSILNA